MILKLQENITEIPKKYRHMVKDFYKTPTGTWMIDLVDGYTTSYGTNYIENKYKKDCLYELMNEVSADEVSLNIDESKNIKPTNKEKKEEASRNELLALAKMQTKTRYEKAAGYKGFSIVDIDTSMLLRDDTITVTCNVGKYYDTIQLMDVLIWIQMESERNPNNQVNTKAITAALMEAIDALEIKVNCTCPDFCLEENTKIKLLNGEVVKVKDLKTKFDNNEELWVYSTDENGDFKPGKVKDVWISGQVSKMIKVTLDNGKEIITTPNHKYMLRDGSYISAENLQEQQSLMPLYFKYTNGYENVKLNSKKTTQYHSVYKIVANTALQDEIQQAKIRSEEETIQIHHKDFNKLNNYPSNLKPMGKMEHWMYHAKLGGDNIQAFIKGGKQFWKEDSRRFEAREKQKKAARDYQLNMWKNFTPEEKRKYIQKCQQFRDNEKLSRSLKEVWNNYSEEEYKNRCNINKINNKKGKQKQSLKRKQYWQNLSDQEYQEHKEKCLKNLQKACDVIRSKPFSEEHKNKISKSLKGKSFSESRIANLRLGGLRSAQQNKETRCLRNLNELIAANIEITSENFLNNRRPGDPHYNKVFNSFEDMLSHFNINTYNHKIAKIEEIYYEEPINVYDLEVENYHNFYVDAGVVLHNCYRFSYQASQLDYKYGKPENRPANITNPNNYGSMCFTGDTLVLTDKGLKPIKDIEIGDNVFTHKGRLRPVLDKSNHFEDKLLEAKIGTEVIKCTENHPFYIYNNKDFEWNNLKEVKWNKNYCCSPKLNLGESKDLPKGYAFLLGLYLSDGHIDSRRQPNGSLYQNQLTIALDETYKQIYEDKIKELGFKYRFKESKYGYDTKCINLQIYDRKLIKFLIEYGGFTYKKEYTKFLNEKCLNWSNQDKLDLINGFFWGDGQFGVTGNKEGYLQYILYNSNKDIMQKLYILIRSFTYARIFSMTKKPFWSKTMNKLITPCEHYLICLRGEHIKDIIQDDSYLVKSSNSYKHPISSYTKNKIDSGEIQYYLTNINKKDIKQTEGEQVYNLKVAEDESYLITRELYAVHNCKHLISMLSNKKWLQQVTGTIMDWVVKNIDKVNEFLRPKEGMELTLPNELARQNAKLGFYSKLFKDKLEDEPEEEVEDNVDNNNDTNNSNDNNDNVEDNKDNNQNNSNNINSNNSDDLDDSNINSDEEEKDNE